VRIEIATDIVKREQLLSLRPAGPLHPNTQIDEIDLSRYTEHTMLVLRFSYDDADTLMDALWRKGLRPTPEALWNSEDREALIGVLKR